MENYNVCVEIVFKGVVNCKALSKDEAIEMVKNNFKCELNHFYSIEDEKITGWNINTKGIVKI